MSNRTFNLFAAFNDPLTVSSKDPIVLAGILAPVDHLKTLKNRLPRVSFPDLSDAEAFLGKHNLVAFAEIVDPIYNRQPRATALQKMMVALEKTMRAWHRASIARNPMGIITLTWEEDAPLLSAAYSSRLNDPSERLYNLYALPQFEVGREGFLSLAEAIASFVADAYSRQAWEHLEEHLKIFRGPNEHLHIFHYHAQYHTCECAACRFRRNTAFRRPSSPWPRHQRLQRQWQEARGWVEEEEDEFSLDDLQNIDPDSITF